MAASFQRLVVLMLENRSFDHMLGFLQSPTYAIEGVDGTQSNPSAVAGNPPVPVTRDARTVHDLNPDPGHDFLNVNVQVYGNSAGQPGGPPMKGFISDYALVSNDAAHGSNIMKCFTAETLPVLSTLAQQFAICDHWFSSVPGSTIPNRLFAHGAHSGGSLTQDVAIAPLTLKTIFEVMDDPLNPATFRIYTDGASVLLANLYLLRHQDHFHSYDEFRNDCLKGDLPEYTFIEPSYDDDPSNGRYARSQHPDSRVDAGEGLITEVYSALRDSPLWESTLLLILYDEHGGIFDHVLPPTLTPDPTLPPVPPSRDPAFDFTRLGVRVPAVLVSPFISPRTIVGRRFDHCSIVATVRKLFCLDKTPFNWREKQAATFDDVLNLNEDQVRTDLVTLPPPFVSAPAHWATVSRVPPAVRKPTDLSVTMAQAMQNAMEVLKVTPTMRVSQIYAAQDASEHLRQSATAVKGGTK
jgi:phospholipase C